METESDIFAGCELDEIFAIVLNHGPEQLRELLGKVQLNRQELLEAAKGMEAGGLADGAKIVREASLNAPVAKDYKRAKQHQAEIEKARRYWGGADAVSEQ
jgi:hypothetical protein